MTITEFLLARIAEDEAAAERGRRHNAPTVYANDNYGYLLVDPARVLAECEAKRAIVKMEWFHFGDSEFGGGMDYAKEQVVQLLAAVYADHPDYDAAWGL